MEHVPLAPQLESAVQNPLREVALGIALLVLVIMFHGLCMRLINRRFNRSWSQVSVSTPLWKINLILSSVVTALAATHMIESIAFVLPLVFSPAGAGKQSIGAVLGEAGFEIVTLVVIIAILGKWVIPRALERIAETRSRELFTLAVLVLAVGIAVGAAKAFGVSMALGAFLAGLAVGRSEFAARAANDALPMRDAFAVLFFVAVGMLFDPMSLVRVPLTIAAVLFVVIVVKPLAATLTVRALGQPMGTAIPIGAAFSQVGEFSFILGTVALGLGLLDDSGWNALVAASIISIALNPYIYRWARRLPSARKAGGRRAVPNSRDDVDPARCILVGYGPVARIVHQLLLERGAEITVIDLNLETVRFLRTQGHRAIYGDALRQGTLEDAGIASAGSLIVSADIDDAAEIIRHARLHNPDLKIIVRCSHLRDAAALRRAGATVVLSGEAEVGVALAEVVTEGDQMVCASAAEHRNTIRRRLYAYPEEDAGNGQEP